MPRPRRLPGPVLLAGGLVAAALVVDVALWNGGCDDCATGSLALKVLAQSLLVGAGLLVVLLVGARILGRSARAALGSVAAVALIAGGALAAPVTVEWETRCRAHEATAMLVDVPRIASSKPRSRSGAYEHTVTLRAACG